MDNHTQDAIRWAVQRAADLYDRQWTMVANFEPSLPNTSNAVQKRFARTQGWTPPDGTEKIPLEIEQNPARVASKITDYLDNSVHDFHSSMPSHLCGHPHGDGGPITFTDDSTGLRDYTLVDGTFIWSVDDRLVSIPYDRWEEMCHDYATMGADLSAAEVARKHGISVPVLKRLFTKYGQYKASPPVLRESILTNQGDLTPLIDTVVENQEAAFLEQLRVKQDDTWRIDYKRLVTERDLEDRLVKNAIEIMAGVVPPKFGSRPNRTRDAKPWRAHIPTTDEHLGKYVWGKESFGSNLTTDISCERLRRHADLAAQWVLDQGGHCEKIYRTLIGDLFHALTGETEHGTRLDQDTRGARVWSMAFDTIEYGIGKLLQVADHVHLVGAKGNHDGFAFWQFMHLLMIRYREEERVTVDAQPGPYGHFRVGESLHIVDHGYRVGSVGGWKAKAQAETTAREVGGEAFHGAKYIYTYIGHKHEWEVGVLGRHHTIIRLESLGEADDYETSLRYASEPVAHLFRLNHSGRITGDSLLFMNDEM